MTPLLGNNIPSLTMGNNIPSLTKRNNKDKLVSRTLASLMFVFTITQPGHGARPNTQIQKGNPSITTITDPAPGIMHNPLGIILSAQPQGSGEQHKSTHGGGGDDPDDEQNKSGYGNYTNHKTRRRKKIKNLYEAITTDTPPPLSDIITAIHDLINNDDNIPNRLLPQVQQLCEYVREKGTEHDKNHILALARRLSLRPNVSFVRTPSWITMLSVARERGINWVINYNIQNIGTNPQKSSEQAGVDMLTSLRQKGQELEKTITTMIEKKHDNEKQITDALNAINNGDQNGYSKLADAIKKANSTRAMLKLAIAYTAEAQSVDREFQQQVNADKEYHRNLGVLFSQWSLYSDERKKHHPLINQALNDHKIFRSTILPKIGGTIPGLQMALGKALAGKNLEQDEQLLLKNLGFSPPLLNPALPFIVATGREMDMHRKYLNLYVTALAHNARLPDNSHDFIRQISRAVIRFMTSEQSKAYEELVNNLDPTTKGFITALGISTEYRDKLQKGMAVINKNAYLKMSAQQKATIERFIVLLSIIGGVIGSMAGPAGTASGASLAASIGNFILRLFFTALGSIVGEEIAKQVIEEMYHTSYDDGDILHTSIENYFGNNGKLTDIMTAGGQKIITSMLSMIILGKIGSKLGNGLANIPIFKELFTVFEKLSYALDDIVSQETKNKILRDFFIKFLDEMGDEGKILILKCIEEPFLTKTESQTFEEIRKNIGQKMPILEGLTESIRKGKTLPGPKRTDSPAIQYLQQQIGYYQLEATVKSDPEGYRRLFTEYEEMITAKINNDETMGNTVSNLFNHYYRELWSQIQKLLDIRTLIGEDALQGVFETFRLTSQRKTHISILHLPYMNHHTDGQFSLAYQQYLTIIENELQKYTPSGTIHHKHNLDQLIGLMSTISLDDYNKIIECLNTHVQTHDLRNIPTLIPQMETITGQSRNHIPEIDQIMSNRVQYAHREQSKKK